MKAAFCTFVVLLLASSALAANVIVIDNFFPSLPALQVQTLSDGTQTEGVFQEGNPVLGTERDVFVSLTAEAFKTASVSVTSSRLSGAFPEEATGFIRVSWDGDLDGDFSQADLSPGLGGVDITFDSAFAFVIRVTADHATEYTFTVYGGGGSSSLTVPVPESTTTLTDFVLLFSDFVGDGDFTSVDGIEMFIDMGVSDAIDTSIDFLTVFTYEVCGFVFEDCDQDGSHDAGEATLTGITATVAPVGNPTNILSTVLSSDGDFCFVGFESAFPNGATFTVCVDDIDGGRLPTVPATGCQNVVLDNLIDPPVSNFGLALDSSVVAPGDVNLNCGDSTDPNNTGFGVATGCVSGIPSFSDVSNNDPCNEVITRTWTLGGFSDVQTITVADNVAPFFNAQPQSQSEACEVADISAWVANNAGATCNDACNTASPANDWPGTQPNPASCGSVSVNFRCVDICGNTNTPVSRTYTSVDNTLPVINPAASNDQAECGATSVNSYNTWLAARGGSSATDNCSAASVTDNRSGITNTCSSSDTVTWTYSDVCGNSASTTATFTISDNTDPNWTTDPQDITNAECNVNAQSLWDSWLAANGNGAASDSCTSVTIANNAGVSPPVGCDQTATVTFTASDLCGRSAVRTATFNVRDTTAPSITSGPFPLSVSCADSTAGSQINTWLNTAGGATTTDACLNVASITNDYDGSTASCAGGETVGFTICDACGQCTTTSSVLSIDDNSAPVFTVPPTDLSTECDSTAQSTYNNWLENDGFSTVTDDCTAPQNIFISNNITSGSGSGSGGGTPTEFEDKLIIDDFTVVTQALIVITPDGSPVTQTSFDSGVTILGSERDVVVSITSGSPGALLTAGTSQGIFSTSAPSNGEGEVRLQYDGADSSTNLDGNVGLGGLDFSAGFALRFAAASDLSTDFDVTMCSTGNVCDTRTISVVGSAGFQDFTVNFVEFSGVDVTSVSAIEFRINSDTDIDFRLDVISVIGPLPAPVPLGCLTETYVGFTAQDLCGNTNTEVAVFTVIDTTAPSITTPAQSVDEECTNNGSTNQINFDAWVSSNANAVATDICNSVSFTNNAPNDITIDNCVNTVTATFFATDSCGNVAPTSASYSVRDTTAPVFTSLAQNFDEPCGGDLQGDLDAWLASRGGAVATDTCSTVTYTNNFSALTGGCTQQALVTFTAFDVCGNANTTTASFTVSDNQPPVLLTPASDDSEQCDNDFNTALATWLNTAGGAQVTDACQDDNTIQLTNDFNTALADCDSELVTFTFTDLCGQSVQTSATFTVIDSSAPVFTTPAQDTSVECDGAGNVSAFSSFVNSRGGAVATDACALSLTFSNNAPQSGPVGCGSVSVSFSVTDECGNSASTSATYTVVDTQAPSFSVAPQDDSAQCNPATNTNTINTWVTARAGAQEFDACTSDANLVRTNSNGQISGDLCNQDHTYTFFVSDECGNTNSDTAVFTIFDLQAPVWDVDPQDVTFECDGFDNTNDVQSWLAQNGLGSASDLCNQVTISNDFTTAPTPCTNTLVNFIATDACGNTATRDAILAIDDTTSPNFTNFPDDVEVPCDSDIDVATTGSPDVVDSCWAPENLSLSSSDTSITEPSNGDCPGDIVFTRTFLVVDPCGNQNTQTQEIRVNIARSSGPCDPEGCECDNCCPPSAPADCLPVECNATPCSSAACAPVDCTCSTDGKNIHPETGIERIALPQCEPVYIYVYDDDDSNNSEDDLEKPLVVADKEIEINERRTRRTRHREHARRALPDVDAAAAKSWFDALFE